MGSALATLGTPHSTAHRVSIIRRHLASASNLYLDLSHAQLTNQIAELEVVRPLVAGDLWEIDHLHRKSSFKKLQFSNLFSMLVVSKQHDSENTTFSFARGEGRGGGGTVVL